MKHRTLKKVLALSFVFVVLGVMYIPILLLIVFSFTNTRTVGSWSGFSLEPYAQILANEQVRQALGYTVLIAVSSALIATLLGTVTAVGIFYMRRKKLKAAVETVNQIPVVNADIVTAIAFMLLFSLTRFQTMELFSLIIAHAMVTTPFVILTVSPRMAQLNSNTYDAGLDLGAGPMRTLFTVILPQLVPSMIAGFAMAFTLSVDDFVVTQYNTSGEFFTLSTYLYDKFTRGGIQPVIKALSSLLFIVSFVVLLVVNIRTKQKLIKEKKKNDKNITSIATV